MIMASIVLYAVGMLLGFFSVYPIALSHNIKRAFRASLNGN